MLFSGSHILSTILLTPLLGAIVIFFIPRERADWHRWTGSGFGVLGLLVSLPLIWRFDSGANAPRFQFIAEHDWIPSLGARYTLGIDGLSLLMVLLTAVLGAIAICSSWPAIREREKEYYALFLILQTAMLGVFLSLDFVLFYFFWELTLVPLYLLIAGWGGERRAYAAMKFFLYTLAGSLIMLLAILAIHHYRQTFDIREILAHPFAFQSDWHAEKWLFWAFFLAFAIRLGMFPFHTWLPDAQTEAPVAVSIALASVVLTMGAYGFLRFSVPMFPDATNKYRGAMVVLSLIAIVYGAFVCLMQKDMKKLIAYSSVPQLGFCTLGIFALTPLGISGGIIQQISHGISTAALFLIFGALYERRPTQMISDFGGLAKPMPRFAAIYLIVTLSALGMPLLSGFIGQFAILQGAIEVHWQWAAWGVFGIILNAAFLLWLYQRVTLGGVIDTANEHLPDLTPREYAMLIPLVLLAFWIGIYPKPLFRVLDVPVKRLVAAVSPGYYATHQSAAEIAAMSPPVTALMTATTQPVPAPAHSAPLPVGLK